MENNRKQVGANSSSSSFTMDLFGPKDSPNSPPPSSSSAGLFGSVFGPSSTGLVRDSSHSKYAASPRKQDSGNQYYGTAKHGTTEYKTQRSKGEGGGSKYQNETAEPCYLSSSIYYGGQEVYSPNSQSSTQHMFKRDGGNEDPNGGNAHGASRGNWWQGSLYY